MISRDVIASLIQSKKEGDYWDFKKEWYRSNADLVHDILCMANSLSQENIRYIIVGVDESNSHSIVSVKADLNRKSRRIYWICLISFV